MVDFRQMGQELGHMLARAMLEHVQPSLEQKNELIDGMIDTLEQRSPNDARVQEVIACMRGWKELMTQAPSGGPTLRVVRSGSKALLVLEEHTLHEAERVLCQAAIESTNTLAEAAASLGISRHALKRRCIKHGLVMPSRASEAE